MIDVSDLRDDERDRHTLRNTLRRASGSGNFTRWRLTFSAAAQANRRRVSSRLGSNV
jgi:hypothetical protein